VATGQAGQGCQSVMNIVSLGDLLHQFIEVLPRRNVIAQIHQRYRVVEMLLGCLEGGSGTLQVLVAGIEVDGRTIAQFTISAGDYLLEKSLGPIELMFLQGP